ncbi:unnamed protein product [Caenorhabditis bovis]|uniref:Uncharacterized protein n=1 Tax=Caenorhabditis bovis TaxID=2654633 RepID=A0A8S1EYN4_9PELO|nr:unnamed protein product [Caenorhabditis bovis]
MFVSFSLLSENWVRADVLDTRELQKSGIVNTGIFTGTRELYDHNGSNGTRFNVFEELQDGTSFFTRSVWIFFLFFESMSLIWSLAGVISCTFSLTTLGHDSSIAGANGIYLWSLLSSVSHGGALALFYSQFQSSIKLNMLLDDQISVGFSTFGQASLSYAFYMALCALFSLYVPPLTMVVFTEQIVSINRKPSELKPEDRETIMKLYPDEKIRNKAMELNVTTLNAKSIIHHLIKYPKAFDVLMQTTGDETVPGVRITRSKRKKTPETGEKVAVTTVDFQFKEDDEFDEDYCSEISDNDVDDEEVEEEDESDEEVSDEEEDDDDELEEEHAEEAIHEHFDEIQDPFVQMDKEEMSAKCPEAERANLNDSSIRNETCSFPDLDTSFHFKSNFEIDDFDPDYLKIINSVIHKEDQLLPDDDPEDADYEYHSDEDNNILDVDYREDMQCGKSTKIPPNEVKRLYMDTIIAVKEIPMAVIPKEAIPDIQTVGKAAERNEDVGKKTQRQKDEDVVKRLRENAENAPQSCTLLRGNNVFFRPCEIEQLKMQLEQHVQLLTQSVVMCYWEKNFFDTKNQAQRMINELDNYYAHYGPQSIFNIPNLGASIESCHDIIHVEPVEEVFTNWSSNTEDVMGPAIRPEAIVVLSRSSAIKFPSLLPKIQPRDLLPETNFTRSEDIMLALALLQFAHLPRRAYGCNTLDRYRAIHENCLPARSPDKIRIHMKTMRNVHEKSSPIHILIAQAEQGICKMEFPIPPVTVIDAPIQLWPEDFQPNWYKYFSRFFDVIDNYKIVPKMEMFRSFVVTPTVAITQGSANLTNSDDSPYISLGTIDGGKPIIMEKQHVAALVNQLFPDESPSKRKRKILTPMKVSMDDEVRRNNDERNQNESPREEGPENADEQNLRVEENSMIDEGSITFITPLTPGKRPMSSLGPIFDASNLDNFEFTTPGGASSSSLGPPPKTPKWGESDDDWRTDFIGFDEYSRHDVDGASECVGEQESRVTFESEAGTSDDGERFSESYDPLRKRRKRSRLEKENMGEMGMKDLKYRHWQKMIISRKILNDIENRLFMHTEKWKKLKSLINDSSIDEEQKVEKIVELFEMMPDVLNLALLFVPIEYLPQKILSDPLRMSYQIAIHAIFDIEGYISAAKIKTPTVRQLFKLISKIEWKNLSSVEAAERFHQLLGHERPLWKRIEKVFYGLAAKERGALEDFEYIDFTKGEIPETDVQFEIISDLDKVFPSQTTIKKSQTSLMVKAGQMYVQKKGNFVPVKIIQNKWTKAYDMELLTAYNHCMKTYKKISVDEILKATSSLPFDRDEIAERMEYLLALL